LNEARWRGQGGQGGATGASSWREKEGEKGGPGTAVGSTGWPAAAPNHRAWAAPLPREQGRAAGIGDTGEGMRVADTRDRCEAGPGVNGGVRESEGERDRAMVGHRHTGPGGTARGGVVQTRYEPDRNSNETKMILNSFKL
jgi:hypothetical protein